MQVLVRDNNVDQALKALKKKMQREGIFREMKLRGHYEKPSEKKAREKAEAVRRARKLARKKLQREGLLPMKPKPAFGAGPGGDRGGPGGGGVVAAPVVPAVRAKRILQDLNFETRALRSAFCFCGHVCEPGFWRRDTLGADATAVSHASVLTGVFFPGLGYHCGMGCGSRPPAWPF